MGNEFARHRGRMCSVILTTGQGVIRITGPKVAAGRLGRMYGSILTSKLVGLKLVGGSMRVSGCCVRNISRRLKVSIRSIAISSGDELHPKTVVDSRPKLCVSR